MMRLPLPGSLRLRFLLAITLWTVLGVSAIWLSATGIFRAHVEQSYHDELAVHVRELGRLTTIGPDGRIALTRPLSDPRYEEPLSGFYWQVTADGHAPLKSGSMTRGGLDEDIAHSPEILHTLDNGPTGPAITYGFTRAGPAGEEIHFVIATDQRELEQLIGSFTRDLTLGLVGLGALLLATGVAIIGFGLHPLDQLSRAIARLRKGEVVELEGRYPMEIAPLAADLNAYVRQNSEMVKRARVQAGNLAHSLRTPLAIITDEAEQLARRPGSTHAAQVLLDQAGAMEQQIEYQLARARSSAGQPVSGQQARLPDVALPILKAMERLHPGKLFRLDVTDCAGMALPIDPVDYSELLASLLDNAGKWARLQVVLNFASNADGRITATITDDGPGIPEAELERVFELGVRLDPAMPGSGLGLAMARDLAETLGLKLVLINQVTGFAAILSPTSQSKPARFTNA